MALARPDLNCGPDAALDMFGFSCAGIVNFNCGSFSPKRCWVLFLAQVRAVNERRSMDSSRQVSRREGPCGAIWGVGVRGLVVL